MSRYVLRSAVFAVVYLAVFLAAAHMPYLPFAPLTVAALWLITQNRPDRRRLDVIMLATTAMVGATMEGAGLLMCATVAVAEVLPALIFAVVLERWSPPTLPRLAASAALAATASAVLLGLIHTDTAMGAALDVARDTVLLMLLTLAVRALRRPAPKPAADTKTEPTRRGHLTVVR